MRPRKVRRILWLMFFGALIAGALLGSSIPDANADPNDISTDSLRWISAGGGQAICAEISEQGMNSNTLIRLFNQVKIVRKESDRDTASIVLLSVQYYCPQYWDGMVSIIQASPEPTTPSVPPLHYAA